MGDKITRVGNTLIATPEPPPHCRECGTEGTRVNAHRGRPYWHCWKCDRPIRKSAA